MDWAEMSALCTKAEIKFRVEAASSLTGVAESALLTDWANIRANSSDSSMLYMHASKIEGGKVSPHNSRHETTSRLPSTSICDISLLIMWMCSCEIGDCAPEGEWASSSFWAHPVRIVTASRTLFLSSPPTRDDASFIRSTSWRRPSIVWRRESSNLAAPCKSSSWFIGMLSEMPP